MSEIRNECKIIVTISDLLSRTYKRFIFQAENVSLAAYSGTCVLDNAENHQNFKVKMKFSNESVMYHRSYWKTAVLPYTFILHLIIINYQIINLIGLPL